MWYTNMLIRPNIRPNIQLSSSLCIKSATQETTLNFICNTSGQLLWYSIFKPKNIAPPLNEHNFLYQKFPLLPKNILFHRKQPYFIWKFCKCNFKKSISLNKQCSLLKLTQTRIVWIFKLIFWSGMICLKATDIPPITPAIPENWTNLEQKRYGILISNVRKNSTCFTILFEITERKKIVHLLYL